MLYYLVARNLFVLPDNSFGPASYTRSGLYLFDLSRLCLSYALTGKPFPDLFVPISASSQPSSSHLISLVDSEFARKKLLAVAITLWENCVQLFPCVTGYSLTLSRSSSDLEDVPLNYLHCMNQESSTYTVLIPFSEMFLCPFLLQVVPFAGKVFAALSLDYRLVARIN